MKISIAQINVRVGDISYNKNKILEFIHKAKKEKSELIVFPEQSLVGYPLNDLVYQDDFLHAQESAMEEILEVSKNIAIVFGFVDLHSSISHDRSRLKYNALAVFSNQKKVAIRYKTLLPNYDVFHEKRYFAPAKEIEPVDLEINGKKHRIGFEICEDLWDDFYETKVTQILAEKGAEIIINLSASPFEIDKFREREERVKNYTKKLSIPFIYCNLVGAQDDIIFDGNSFVFNKTGEKIITLKSFEEDLQTFDISENKKANFSNENEYELLLKALTLGIKDYAEKNNFKKAVLGLSGGIDSALVSAIAAEALGAENVLNISMPSKFSSDHSKNDAKQLAKNYGMDFKTISIENFHKEFEKSYSLWFPKQKVSLTDENIQARLRGLILMAHSNQEGQMLLTTGNKTEYALGYTTLYGDMNGALAVIGDLSKYRVFELSKYINQKYGKEMIPVSIIEKTPSAELRENQFDPFDYVKVSPLVEEIVEGRKSREELIKCGYDKTLIEEMLQKYYFSEYKRFQAAIILKVTSKAFGFGRLFPLTNKFRG
jgi:NAD+ synthase (glutamine-hydrolysing)